ncbi:MAG: hypothetical protein KBC53_02760 [Nitrosomonas sp.]|nr:hypothetical protein [Nitrosomonas sp.]
MAELSDIFNFKFFAPNFLKVKNKRGEIVSFVFNRAQEYIQERLDAQLAATGKVRAIILKGRQQGCSTLIQGRYFHKVITQRGKSAYILTHETKATHNLFAMTKRYHENLPDGLAPKADKDSATELNFSSLDSGYSVGTAGSRGTGRGVTAQLFHGSEVAYWDHAEEHAQGVLQAISNELGTEIILESTANGLGNLFHNLWVGAEQGVNGYQAIFIPWYWQDEYRDLTPGFKATDEELYFLEQYRDDGMTMEHLSWRRLKIFQFSRDFDEGLALFNVEYPISASVAFRNSIGDTFIASKFVDAARRNRVESDAQLIIGVDPAIGNNDRCAITHRRGRKITDITTLRNYNTMELAGYVVSLIRQFNPSHVFIDCIGIGAGTVDRLHEMGFQHIVIGVNVARSAANKEKYGNLRAELWDEMKQWLMQPMGVQIPDDDDLHRDLASLGFKYNSSGKLYIESKKDAKDRGLPSPDLGDSTMLTFAYGPTAGASNHMPEFVPEHHRSMFR